MRPYVCTWWVISSFSTPYVCMANSRVGDNMTTPVPDTHTHHVTPLRSYLHLCYDYNNQRMTICTLTISGHKFEFVDKFDGGNQESQSFTASCFSCSQHVSVVQEWAHISNIYTTNKQMWWLLYHWNPTKSDALQTHLPSAEGRMVLCWISVMVSKPISITPSVYSHWPLQPKMQMTCPQTHLRKSPARKSNHSYLFMSMRKNKKFLTNCFFFKKDKHFNVILKKKKNICLFFTG